MKTKQLSTEEKKTTTMENQQSKKSKKRRFSKQNNSTITTNTTSNNSNTSSSNNNNKKKLKDSKKTGSGYMFRLFTWVCFLLVFIYGVVPASIWLCPELCTFVIFSNRFRWPPFLNLSNPHDVGLENTRNFYVSPKRNIQIGVWHVLPDNMASSEELSQDYQFEQSLQQSNSPVVLYMHGNTGTRAGWHRVQLYKLLAHLNYHTLAFDYRGYGDSTGIPSEDGVVEDSNFLFSWIKERVSEDTPIILWGHSLGTGIATKLAKILCDNGTPPTALVLESPFNNILEATENHPFLHVFKYTYMQKLAIIKSVQHSGIEFASDQSIGGVTNPVVILHAEDDGLIPIELGKKLYEAGIETRPKDSGPIRFVTFNGSEGYGHKHIHKAPELPQIISSFVQSSIEHSH